jgi:hypothetical protein
MIDDHSSAAPAEESLFGDVTSLIEKARGRVALTVDAELTMLYWGIGTRIREDVLDGARGEYGQQSVQRLADQLTQRYGRGCPARGSTRPCGRLHFASAHALA